MAGDRVEDGRHGEQPDQDRAVDDSRRGLRQQAENSLVDVAFFEYYAIFAFCEYYVI
jgi:hypothetical protein